MNTPATARKRRDLQLLIDRLVKNEQSIDAVVGIGSIATGTARDESDIDAFIFMHPMDRHILPTEALWCPMDNSFHSIFIDDSRIQREGIGLDLIFADTSAWSDPGFDWLDEFILALDRLLDGSIPEETWKRYPPIVCFNRLRVVYDAIIGALFAYGRRWRFFSDRETLKLLGLEWLPEDIGPRLLRASTAPAYNEEKYLSQVRELRDLSEEIVQKLIEDGIYGKDPGSEAFMRRHDEPGRGWNMAEWNEKHAKRKPAT